MPEVTFFFQNYLHIVDSLDIPTDDSQVSDNVLETCISCISFFEKFIAFLEKRPCILNIHNSIYGHQTHCCDKTP